MVPKSKLKRSLRNCVRANDGGGYGGGGGGGGGGLGWRWISLTAYYGISEQ